MRQKVYWILEPRIRNAISEQSQFYLNGNIKELVINRDKVKYESFFKLVWLKQTCYIVITNVVKSLLRRQIRVVKFQKIKKIVKEGCCECQKKMLKK